MGKILLFYKYINIAQPNEMIAWQRRLCKALEIKGRIFIAQEGINGTLGGKEQAIEEYKRIMLEHPLFSDLEFKESLGDNEHFPRLTIKFKKEIVNLGLEPNRIDLKQAGKHLTASQVHELINNKPQNLIILDARNNYESAIGKFDDAITPEISYFREFPEYIDKNLESFKDKEVLMYCTGGIRCEKASAYLKAKNIAKEVYQIKGGIHKYLDEYPDGHFRGKNYVFDGRISIKANDDILGSCICCKKPYDEYTNCINAECNKQMIICDRCIVTYHNTCSVNCLSLVKAKKVNLRTIPAKVNNLMSGFFTTANSDT